jgi:polyhydroxyalkanoate synthesis repressor PhaR
MSTSRIIKKYPNRRLYDTDESRYITLADVRDLVLRRVAFTVIDKKSGHDITRLVLLQVISEQEHNGAAIMSEEFLSQVIRAYGCVAQGLMAGHLEDSLDAFMSRHDHEPQQPLMQQIGMADSTPDSDSAPLKGPEQ